MREGAFKTVMSLGNSSNDFPAEFEDDLSPPVSSAPTRKLDEVFSLAYEELRRLARILHRSEAHVSLTPTAIVNEAWIKLSRTPSVASVSPLHFKRIAARAMRQVLVDAARRRNTHLRGSEIQKVTFDEALYSKQLGALDTDREVLALDAALEELSRLEPRQAALVEARFFGGLEIAEITVLLGISEATALRDWRAAKAWLAVEVRRALAGDAVLSERQG